MEETSSVKQSILDNALYLFSEKGYEGVSVNELTSKAGITKPTLYYYFNSKEGLFEAVCQSNYARLNNAIAKSTLYIPNPESYHDDIFMTLTNVAMSYFSFAIENEIFYRLAMSNIYLPRSSSVFEIVGRYHFEQYEIIGKMFRDMSESHGNLYKKDKRLAWSFIGAINTYIGLVFNGVTKEELNKVTAKVFISQFMHGIYA